MGSGKTTIGRQLARALGLEFYDLDWYIDSIAQWHRYSQIEVKMHSAR